MRCFLGVYEVLYVLNIIIKKEIVKNCILMVLFVIWYFIKSACFSLAFYIFG